MHYAVQAVAGFFASFFVGMLWYSPTLFGRLWWKLQFPGKPFGDLKIGYSPYPFTMIGVAIHSCLVTYFVNTFKLEMMGAMLLVSMFLLFHTAVSVPHYVFPGFPLLLLVLNTAYDVCHSLAATAVIVLLKWTWTVKQKLNCCIDLASSDFLLYYFFFFCSGLAAAGSVAHRIHD